MEVVIREFGSKTPVKGFNSCKRIMNLSAYFSENEHYYYYGGILLPGSRRKHSLVAFKNTEEGKQISNLIQARSENELIAYIGRIFIQHCDTDEILQLFNEIADDSYNRGVRDKQGEIRQVLFGERLDD